MQEWIAYVAPLVVVIVLLALSLRRVPSGEVWVLKRGSGETRNIEAGWHLIWPLYERILRRVNMLGRTIHVSLDDVSTADQIRVEVSGRLYFQVLDARKAAGETGRLDDSANALSEATTREMVGEIDAETLGARSRRDLNLWLLGLLNQSAANWGVRFTRVDLRFGRGSS